MKDFIKKNQTLIGVGAVVLAIIVISGIAIVLNQPKQVKTVHVLQQQTQWVKLVDFSAQGKGTDVDENSQSFVVKNGNIKLAYQVQDGDNAYARICLSGDNCVTVSKKLDKKLTDETTMTVKPGDYTVTVDSNTPVNVQVSDKL